MNRLAIAIHLDLQVTRKELREGFAAIREEMATKKDLERFATKEEMATGFSTLADRIVNAKDELQEQINGLKYGKEIDELRERVNVLEHKLGIRPNRRAA